MKLRYRFRCYPTPEQEGVLAQTFGACRYAYSTVSVYNWALRLRTDSYRNGVTVNYNASSAALTILKQQPDHHWLNEVSSVPTQQALRHLQDAFANFSEKRGQYPSFKKKRGAQAAEYTRNAFKWDAANRTLTLAKVGRLKVRWSRTFTSEPTTVTITKDGAGRYFVTLVLDEPVQPLPKTDASVGVDLGVNHLATLSTGEHIHNPRYQSRYQRKLARAQRRLAHKQPGTPSRRRERARVRVAKLQAKIADTRRDHLHKVTTDLVRRFDVICIEDLNVRGMVRNHSLARAISDVGMGEFARLLDYKCAWYGKELVKIDRFFPSSKTCSVCGHLNVEMPLSVRAWTCPECGTAHDRDENAAKNIYAVGHTVKAQGGHVRPASASVLKGSARRTVNRPVQHRV